MTFKMPQCVTRYDLKCHLNLGDVHATGPKWLIFRPPCICMSLLIANIFFCDNYSQNHLLCLWLELYIAYLLFYGK